MKITPLTRSRRFRECSAYSLVEIMIAIVFISIGFFGYVALHSRILHSGQRLEEREVIRAGTDYFEALETGRVILGFSTSITTESFHERSGMEGLYSVRTDLEGRDKGFLQNIRPEFLPGLEETMETSPVMMSKPYEYSWTKR
ncbi:MAG: hypothetical protein KC800_07915 [Candidatus Eremiobacteraeota bacterium]|nr:hypothetical protein [Candidatus Eremiobacteraeota bacterium]